MSLKFIVDLKGKPLLRAYSAYRNYDHVLSLLVNADRR